MNRLAVKQLDSDKLPEWQSDFEENIDGLYRGKERPAQLPAEVEGRRKYFATQEHRQGLTAGPRVRPDGGAGWH
jgi:hypothetical protein